jgi:hypothetical protein
MLSKCANPSCSAQFHYMYEGKLFLLSNDSRVRNVSEHKVAAMQFAWLCDECSRVMRVVLDRNGAVKIIADLCAGILVALGSTFLQFSASPVADLTSSLIRDLAIC